MQWDVFVPQPDIPGLIANKDPRFQLLSESANNPYLVFNTKSPNNNKALENPTVRQAISYAIDRSQLVQDGGGPTIAVPLTHVMAARHRRVGAGRITGLLPLRCQQGQADAGGRRIPTSDI